MPPDNNSNNSTNLQISTDELSDGTTKQTLQLQTTAAPKPIRHGILLLLNTNLYALSERFPPNRLESFVEKNTYYFIWRIVHLTIVSLMILTLAITNATESRDGVDPINKPIFVSQIVFVSFYFVFVALLYADYLFRVVANLGIWFFFERPIEDFRYTTRKLTISFTVLSVFRFTSILETVVQLANFVIDLTISSRFLAKHKHTCGSVCCIFMCDSS